MSFPAQIRSAASLQRVRGLIAMRARANALAVRAALEQARMDAARARERIAVIEARAGRVRAWLAAPEAAQDIGRAARDALRRLAALEAEQWIEADVLAQAEARVADKAAELAIAQAEVLRQEGRLNVVRARRLHVAARWEGILEEAAAEDVRRRPGVLQRDLS